MKPNLGRNKTALLYGLRGKGSNKAAAEFFGHGKVSMYLEDLQVHLPVTNQYKHLGGLLDSKSTMAAEARRRLSMATQAFDKGKQLIYLNHSISLGVRANVLQTAVTCTYHNLGLWVPEGKGWTMLCGGYTRLVRKLLSRTLQGDALFRLPASVAHVIILDALHWKRLRERPDCEPVNCGVNVPRGTGSAVGCPPGGADVVAGGLRRPPLACCRCDSSTWRAVDGADWPTWHNLFTHRTAWVKRQIRCCLARDFVEFQKKQAIVAAVWVLYSEVGVARQKADTAWVCRPCNQAFRSKGGLGAHGRKARYRAVVAGTVCQACGTQFWDANRFSRLRDSPDCVSTLRQHGLFADCVVPGSEALPPGDTNKDPSGR